MGTSVTRNSQEQLENNEETVKVMLTPLKREKSSPYLLDIRNPDDKADALLFLNALKDDDAERLKSLGSLERFAGSSFGSDHSPALVIAAAHCGVEVVTKLLNCRADPNAHDRENRVPALVAAASGNSECLRLLMDRGAKADFVYEKPEGNDVAGEVEAWRIEEDDCIGKLPVPACSKSTLLHEAAMFGEQLIAMKMGEDDQTSLQEVNADHQDQQDNVSPHTSAKKSSSKEDKTFAQRRNDCVRILLSSGATSWVKNDDGLSGLDAVLMNVDRPITLIEGVFNEQINYVGGSHKKIIKINFKPLCLKKSDFQTEALYEFLENTNLDKSGRQRIFKHPLLRAFVRKKWQSLCRLFYINVFLYVLHVLSLSAFVTLAHCDVFYIFGVGWRQETAKKGIPISKIVLISTSALVSLNVFWLSYVLKNRYRWKPEMLINSLSCILSFLVIGLTANDLDSGDREPDDPIFTKLRTATNETTEFFVETRRNASNDASNSTAPSSSDISDWVMHLTCSAVFMAWLEMMLLVGRFPKWASQALLFAPVLKNVCRVLITYGCMIFGFTFVFFLQFRKVDPDSFGDPWRAFIKTIIMMMGEYEYNDIFGHKDNGVKVWSPSSLPFLSRVIFLAFVVIASIALMNLMVGLAVSDTQELVKMSFESQLKKLAQSVIHWEYFISSTPAFFRGFMKTVRLIPKDQMEISMRYSSSDDYFPEELEENLGRIAKRRYEDELKKKMSVSKHSAKIFLPTNGEDRISPKLARLLNAIYGDICTIRELLYDEHMGVDEHDGTISRTKSFYENMRLSRNSIDELG